MRRKILRRTVFSDFSLNATSSSPSNARSCVSAAPVVASPLLPWPGRLVTLVPLVAVAVIPRTRHAAIDTVTVVWRALRGDDQPVISSSYNRTNASI